MEQEKTLLEKLAWLEHDRWSRWEKYRESITEVARKFAYIDEMSEKEREETIENAGLSEQRILGWKRKRKLSYSELTEQEKESDRKEARKTIAVIIQELDKKIEEQKILASQTKNEQKKDEYGIRIGQILWLKQQLAPIHSTDSKSVVSLGES